MKSCGMKKYSKGGNKGLANIGRYTHPVGATTWALQNMGKGKKTKDTKDPKGMKEGEDVSDEFENSKLARDSMNEAAYRPSRGPTTRRRANRMPKYADGGKVDVSKMTDEERYGKVGAEIRRLDPEAFKNRPKTAEGNIALLKELRAKAKGGEKAPSAPYTMTPEEFGSMTRVNPRPAPPRPAPSAPRSAGQRPVPKGRGDRTSSSGLTVREARIASGKESPFERRSMMGTAGSRREAIAQGYDRKPRREAIEKGKEALGKKTGGAIKKYAAGGAVRGDGICRVKTKGRMR